MIIGHKWDKAMANKRSLTTDPGEPMVYQIRIKGHVGRQWTYWFGGLTIDTEGDEVTLISGFVVDQAALQALLTRVHDLGLVLVSVNRLPLRK